MNRRQIIQLAALLPFSQLSLASALGSLDLKNSETMPVLFLGHGSPSNALENNWFTQNFQQLGKQLRALKDKPQTILCVSAHWETNGSRVTAMQNPYTIHDFYGFPRKLHKVKYPVSGSPELASYLQNNINPSISLDTKWGLDHGTWSVLMHLYPDADIPVLQLSLDANKTLEQHYHFAQELATLRKKGVLIVGSGNIVHNLRRLKGIDNQIIAHDWAVEASHILNKNISSNNYKQLLNYKALGEATKLAIPTAEHFLPLIYTLALKEKNDTIELFNNKIVEGSISMTSVKIGMS